MTPPQISLSWDDIQCVTAQGVATLQCVPAVFKLLINWALILAGTVAVFMIVLSGIKYVTSRGDPKAVQGAQGTLTWAVIGLVIIFLSFSILNFIAYFTGTSCILKFGFTACQ